MRKKGENDEGDGGGKGVGGGVPLRRGKKKVGIPQVMHQRRVKPLNVGRVAF